MSSLCLGSGSSATAKYAAANGLVVRLAILSAARDAEQEPIYPGYLILVLNDIAVTVLQTN